MTGDIASSILPKVASYYASKLALHGATSRGVDWNGRDSHDLRHRQFLRLLEGGPEASVIDLGCGYGDFLPFLRAAGHEGFYCGYDIAAAMIETAGQLHGVSERHAWRVGAEPVESADFAVASGIFNVKGDVSDTDWVRYISQTVDILARSSRRGFAFNVLSLSSDPERRRSNLYYADPCEMLGHCLSQYGRTVALLQDYGLYEFTVIVRHQGVTT
jgi:SAM-dependent methyltransferase